KVAITGPNGSGKSTLLTHINNGGEGITLSPKAEIGVFRQMSYRYRADKSVFDFMVSEHDHYRASFIRTVLHKMLFTHVDLQKKVGCLSGGEAMRLKLCQLFLGTYNVLLLDEPTNFLDIQARKALEDFVLGYEGTIVMVSHD